MLDGGRDEVTAAGWLQGLGQATNRQIVGLGAAAGEDHFGRFGPNQSGDRRPRLVQCRFGLLTEVMN